MNYKVKISGKDYNTLYEHLFPGDNNEAVAIALCGHHPYNDSTNLMVHRLLCIPYKECQIRKPDLLKWKTSLLEPLLAEAMKKNLSILKIHSHPNGYNDFSKIDDDSDIELFQS